MSSNTNEEVLAVYSTTVQHHYITMKVYSTNQLRNVGITFLVHQDSKDENMRL